jgi:hypothetical protein
LAKAAAAKRDMVAKDILGQITELLEDLGPVETLPVEDIELESDEEGMDE